MAGVGAQEPRGGAETRILSRNEKDLGFKFPIVKDSTAALDRDQQTERKSANQAIFTRNLIQLFKHSGI